MSKNIQPSRLPPRPRIVVETEDMVTIPRAKWERAIHLLRQYKTEILQRCASRGGKGFDFNRQLSKWDWEQVERIDALLLEE